MKMYTQPCSSTIACMQSSTMQNGLLFKHKSFVQFDAYTLYDVYDYFISI